MDLGIAGRVALVTGGSRGLGREAALSLAREGVNVAICGRTRATLDATVEEIRAHGVTSTGVVADASDVDGMDSLHSQSSRRAWSNRHTGEQRRRIEVAC